MTSSALAFPDFWQPQADLSTAFLSSEAPPPVAVSLLSPGVCADICEILAALISGDNEVSKSSTRLGTWDPAKCVMDLFLEKNKKDIRRPCNYGWMDGQNDIWCMIFIII